MPTIPGTNGNDILFGTAGNDTLDGLLGADTMDGGDGNDTYYVDNVGDIVKEFYDDALGGTADTVFASVTYSLAPGTFYNQGYGIENLTLTGFGNINATGNSKNNILTGNSGSNVLNGGAGNDTLDGLLGADTMDGGDGNDTYFVDNVGDIVKEFYDDALGGTADTVFASVTYSLAPGTFYNQGHGIENLTLTGFGNINATGNSKNNILTGNSGSNVLDGLLGADTMDGGDGNDTYFVDNVGDIVKEFYDDALGGTADTVLASVTYSLAPGTFYNQGHGIENLTLTGFGNINATGNGKDNILTGNSGSNVLNGGAGNDTLNGGAGVDTLTGGVGTGGVGNDSFRLDNVANRDLITDFSVPDDTIILANSLDSTLPGSLDPGIKGLIFNSGNVNGSVLNASWFFKGAGFTGGASGNLSGIYVNTGNGDIWYNDSNLVGSYLIANVGAGAAAGMTNLDFVYWA
ncbi:MAG: calcium-binding protein [Microcystis aeruginosa Ma_QC_Ch_20071001_S25]|nr:MAG: calcium-binding protein [Microcystis aeruginosa Ma_QC_Ch_20071001_S25]